MIVKRGCRRKSLPSLIWPKRGHEHKAPEIEGNSVAYHSVSATITFTETDALSIAWVGAVFSPARGRMD